MTAPRDAYASRDFVVINMNAVGVLGSWESAGVFQRIAYRCELEGSWTATLAEIAADVRLSEHKTKRALTHLREVGWVTSERADRWSPVQRWTVVWDSPSRDGDFPLHVREEPTVTVKGDSTVSLSTKKEREETHAPQADAGTPVLFAVPETEPPKTAQTLVARWVDGYRAANDGADPPGPYMKRVAGQCKNLARACGSDADWSAAWHAAYAAGEAGGVDPTRFLVQQRSRFPQRTSNVYVGMASKSASLGMLDDLLGTRPAIGGTPL